MQHPGQTPVYMKIQSEGIVFLLSRENWCEPDSRLLGSLRRMYGESGVVLK